MTDEHKFANVTIVRADDRQRWTVVSNDAVEDSRLSFRALGLLVFLLSKPPHWKTHVAHLATTHKEGREAVRKALGELETAGYVTRRWVRGTEDATPSLLYVVSENPQVRPACPETGIPDSGAPRNRDAQESASSKYLEESVSTEISKPTAPREHVLPAPVTAAVATGHSSAQQLFEAVAEVWTGQRWPIQVTTRARGYINSAIPGLREQGATYDEVHRRAAHYRQQYDKRPTPAALDKHWPSLDRPPLAPVRGSNRSLAAGQRWLNAKEAQ